MLSDQESLFAFMSNPRFIPERYCTFSSQLAATIGLEEAVLLQGLGNQLSTQKDQQSTISITALVDEFPFWDTVKIGQLLQRIVDLGILPARPSSSDPLVWVTTDNAPIQSAPERVTSTWAPSEHLIDLLNLNHGLTRKFTLEQLTTFDRTGDIRTLEARFRHHVLARWRQQQKHPAFTISEPRRFDNAWEPSADAKEILVRTEMPEDFLESIRPEFILYWKERGGAPKDVNSKFIQFARQRWVRHANSLQHSTVPERLDPTWKPNAAVYETLELSDISAQYIDSVLNEFIVYWVDSNEVHTSWNAKFLQHVKYQWQRHQEQASGRSTAGGGARPTDRTKDRSITDDLSDTSWAG
ncbi:DnaT-like ssDNA-binding domain-containing protein [Luminiphilus sp.]|jgi:hypothetical protein|nr:DnaT-like ssDNA-binding domain-containing protein [Luminiphilus sp.]MDA8591014.1 DnaT-like ssDNA-binding domain-containing protein [Luminiphilus sp.]MDA8738938.1 DnaT-like ssDNA-binding domain-containing protein [Luminiphilus sp.]MDA8797523.1 DnaT-like ssDNA-binding domain-containing protein [Luminiphilus sp.]MDB2316289.1 DnaT-like ssDNA-binding domain-containing protein [Luminiphilus sp.]